LNEDIFTSDMFGEWKDHELFTMSPTDFGNVLQELVPLCGFFTDSFPKRGRGLKTSTFLACRINVEVSKLSTSMVIPFNETGKAVSPQSVVFSKVVTRLSIFKILLNLQTTLPAKIQSCAVDNEFEVVDDESGKTCGEAQKEWLEENIGFLCVKKNPFDLLDADSMWMYGFNSMFTPKKGAIDYLNQAFHNNNQAPLAERLSLLQSDGFRDTDGFKKERDWLVMVSINIPVCKY
jgi:hypothetical protein